MLFQYKIPYLVIKKKYILDLIFFKKRDFSIITTESKKKDINPNPVTNNTNSLFPKTIRSYKQIKKWNYGYQWKLLLGGY